MRTEAIQPDYVISRSSNVEFSKLDDEMLAIDEQAEYCYALNEAASRVWELTATPISVGAVCARLCEEFVVDADTCFGDVVQLLEGLREAGLVQVSYARSD